MTSYPTIQGQFRLLYRDLLDAYLNDWKNFEFILIVTVSIGMAAGMSQQEQGISAMFKFFISPIALVIAGAIIYHAVVFYLFFKQ